MIQRARLLPFVQRLRSRGLRDRSVLRSLHPLLFALAPVLALLAHNVEDLPGPAVALRPLLLSAAAGLILLAVLRLALRDLDRAAPLCSLALTLFYAYGHLYQALEATPPLGLPIGRHRYLLPLLLALLAGAALALRRARRLDALNTALAVAGLALVAWPGTRLTGWALEEALQAGRAPGPMIAAPPRASTAPQPDIYYIVLDGYARGDVLAEVYALDNQPFLDRLRGLGFYVADEARSNYALTSLSLASAMRMEYLDDLAETLGPDSRDQTQLKEFIRHGPLRAFLEARGYQVVAFESGFPYTEIRDAAHFIRPATTHGPLEGLSAFEGLLLRTTATLALFDLNVIHERSVQQVVLGPAFEEHRNRVTGTLAGLREVARWDGHYFVFAHVIAPHPPFVFDAQGARVPQRGPLTLNDGMEFDGSGADYIAGYRAQLLYVNQLLEQTLLSLLADSDPAPIIIVQADHGPGARLAAEGPTAQAQHERTAILSAYFLPGGYADLYPSITPVNTFRVVLRQLFDAELPLLDDRSYFSRSPAPYRFVPVP